MDVDRTHTAQSGGGVRILFFGGVMVFMPVLLTLMFDVRGLNPTSQESGYFLVGQASLDLGGMTVGIGACRWAFTCYYDL
jgi:hypothetical protein